MGALPFLARDPEWRLRAPLRRRATTAHDASRSNAVAQDTPWRREVAAPNRAGPRGVNLGGPRKFGFWTRGACALGPLYFTGEVTCANSFSYWSTTSFFCDVT